ncbi:amino acid/amide ABC transport system permease protein HAAT family (plasmid) [Cupriavidus necator N-1]|uniref:Amino acid/amide ABC transport system permease protein HAAT family n=1 Tax=Cupriavidus necator (strain ATCC 43291 / DSM 13513 / CCUG 52238 / LMG 8453 / N-1) TaxID=1042878 RepID=F8GV93_CUPNN|nr:branched-chain amino acid ABC transporter permease [Cupriavidus necator]AEI82593.1 amino acid/amide ABC transport system permease protein HAAT family [Cupriavidus necator N-1]MDX6007594.1 branched-chain amino acid ABC transporter permease [Cupriavidus necator]
MLVFLFEQLLNGVQFGLMLFLLAAGLTLVFGIMNMINLAHGSLYMIGAYLVATLTLKTDSFLFGLIGGVALTAAIGVVLEMSLLRRLYDKDHLTQVLVTFGIILIANQAVQEIWGAQPIMTSMPPSLSESVPLIGLFEYPVFRLFIIVVGLLIAALLALLITKTRVGMWIRAGAADREMARAMGANINLVFSLVFGLGAALCAIAGGLLGPLLSINVGMGESILILAFVVVVIGGIGSVQGALAGAVLVGVVDALGRALIPMALRSLPDQGLADSLASTLSAVSIYLLMALVLYWRPQGLFSR